MTFVYLKIIREEYLETQMYCQQLVNQFKIELFNVLQHKSKQVMNKSFILLFSQYVDILC